MSNVWTITVRELKSFFVSPIAYLTSAFFLLVTGALFAAILTSSADASLRPLFGNITFIVLLIAPALTMKVLADERRMGTIELLFTAPVHDWQIVVGKYLGALILYLTMFVGPTLYYFLILRVFGQPEIGPTLTGYLGVFLLGASFLAVGVFTSSLTQNQIIAWLGGFAILILLWIADALASWAGYGPVRDAFSYMAITRHYENFLRGVVELADVLYPLSIVAVFLFLTTQLLQSRRWR
ncbi:MAG: ABC transporter permease subunit [Chloroflexi bacterium]|nr:ABC transporter permease subunit [Chloroflexota bacterium]